MSVESHKGLLLKADPIANAFRDEVKSAILSSGGPCKLIGILSTSSVPSKFYAEFTQKQCLELGVDFILKKTGSALDATLSDGEGVEEAIIEANEDDSVDGIMVCVCFVVGIAGPIMRVLQVYYPVFGVQQVGNRVYAGILS